MSILNPWESGARITAVYTDFDSYTPPNITYPDAIFTPNLEDTTTITITLKNIYNNVTLPTNVQLAIYACLEPIKRRTNAQVEQRMKQNSIA